MGQYAVKRFLTIVPVLIGVSLIVFGFIQLIPGDPAVTMLGGITCGKCSAYIFSFASRRPRGSLRTKVL